MTKKIVAKKKQKYDVMRAREGETLVKTRRIHGDMYSVLDLSIDYMTTQKGNAGWTRLRIAQKPTITTKKLLITVKYFVS